MQWEHSLAMHFFKPCKISILERVHSVVWDGSTTLRVWQVVRVSLVELFREQSKGDALQ
eukprot:m.308080 g.308080  ORF g.308080 m.308080 type:complete len:59 (+) comp20763_c0_seq1:1079-1255(+)